MIRANADGTIEAPQSFQPRDARFHEVVPDVWRGVEGTRELVVRNVNGVKTVIDSEDRTSVLQAVPGYRSASLNVTVLLGFFVMLIGIVILWPTTFLMRRHYQRPLAHSPQGRRLRLFLRIAAVFTLVWLLCWTLMLMPILKTQVDVYSTSLDPVIRTLQIAGFAVVVLTAVSLWSFWRSLRLEPSWLFRISNGAFVATLLGTVWIGVVGGLISFNLNY